MTREEAARSVADQITYGEFTGKKADEYCQRLYTGLLALTAPEAGRDASHCRDCCCAQLWKALGIMKNTGKSLVEHVAELRAQAERPVDYEAAYRAHEDAVERMTGRRHALNDEGQANVRAIVDAALARKVTDPTVRNEEGSSYLAPSEARKPTPEPAGERYRVGRKVGRTIYETGPNGDSLIGMMDNVTDARKVVDALNDAARSRPVWTRDDLLQNIDAFAKGRCTRGELADAILRGMK